LRDVNADAAPLVPARIVNEYEYCPRLAYLEWVQGEFKENADVAEGKLKHKRVDEETGALPPAEEADPDRPIAARSVMLSSERLGLIGRLDLVEGEGKSVVPVDYKRGKAPDVPDGAWEADRLQVCAQVLLLREAGYACGRGIVYYAESRRRVAVEVDEDLALKCMETIAAVRRMAVEGTIPPPLVNSPKCVRCSLAPICLPDEVGLLRGDADPADVRRIFPARDDAAPLYLTTQGLSAGVSGERVEVREKGKKVKDVRLLDVSQVCLFGNIQVTTQAVKAFAERGVPVCYFSSGGWFQAFTQGMTHKNVELRRLQYAAAADSVRSLGFARRFAAGKIRNSRTLLRRNHPEDPSGSLAELARLAESAEKAATMETLLGLEGAAARTYFSRFGELLQGGDGGLGAYDFNGRSRRPSADPVNAVLSFLYAMLAKELTTTALAVGFDPFLGFYHQPRYGRPALALDLMEEFRPLVAESAALTLINRKEIQLADFLRRGNAVTMSDSGRKAVVRAYERRMDELVTHPRFGYQVSYRRVLEIQARLMGRALSGEIPGYEAFETR
jgi:CRISPR-associated protein Cas1